MQKTVKIHTLAYGIKFKPIGSISEYELRPSIQVACFDKAIGVRFAIGVAGPSSNNILVMNDDSDVIIDIPMVEISTLKLGQEFKYENIKFRVVHYPYYSNIVYGVSDKWSLIKLAPTEMVEEI